MRRGLAPQACKLLALKCKCSFHIGIKREIPRTTPLQWTEDTCPSSRTTGWHYPAAMEFVSKCLLGNCCPPVSRPYMQGPTYQESPRSKKSRQCSRICHVRVID